MHLQDQENSVHEEQFSNAENNLDKPDSDNIATSAEIPSPEDVTDNPEIKPVKSQARKKPVKKTLDSESDIEPVKKDIPDEQISAVIADESAPDDEIPTQQAGSGSSLEDIQPTFPNFTSLSKEDLVINLEELLHAKPVNEIRREIEAIKVNFYKKHRAETEVKRKKFIEEGGLVEEFEVPIDPIEEKASELLRQYRELRLEYNRHQDDAKLDNLRMRHEIIEEIKELNSNEESINKTFHEFRELQNRWREIGPIPQQNINDLWETYHHHIEKFYDYIKINQELRDLDLKKNLETKIQLCEKAENLLLEPNVVNAFASLQVLHEQWREIGPVPKEKRSEIWERFKEATSKINKKHQHYYQELKDAQNKNLESKVLLSDKAEEISVEELLSHKDWVRRTNDILELQKVWKTIGFAPKKDNIRIYNRFRAACDKFFERKRSFYAQNQDVQGSNLQLKLEFCLQAEVMQDSTDWKKTTDDFIHLQRKWKETGPAPRKHSEQVWKRFRNACDKFFASKTEFFSTIDTRFEENLASKEAIIKEIESFVKTGNSNSDLEKLQAYQRQWTEIGFVPYDKKDDLQQRYRDAVNTQFDGLEVDENKKSLLKFKNRIEGLLQKANQESKIRFEREKYMIKLQQLKTDIGVWENNIGFFANTSKAESMLKDFAIKIKEARDAINLLEEKINIIDDLNID